MQNPGTGSPLTSGTVEPEERRGSGIVGIGNLIDDDVNPQVESAWGFWIVAGEECVLSILIKNR